MGKKGQQNQVQLVLLDTGTISLLSFLIYHERGVVLPFLFLLGVNSAALFIFLYANRQHLRIHHLLGKAKMAMLYDYMVLHALSLVAGIALPALCLGILGLSFSLRQLLCVTECGLFFFLTNSFSFYLFLRKCL